jgi:hypothetical protein
LTAAAVLFGVQAPAQALSNATWGSGGNIIGMDYQHINYGGAYLQRRSSNPGCTASLSDIDAGGKVPSAWDNQISSFENFGGGVSGWYRCYSKHWEHAGSGTSCSGAVIGWSLSMSNIGSAMNDQTSCIQFS